MSSEKAAEIAARLDRLPPSRTIWTMVILISLGGVFEFYDLFFTGYVAPGMVQSGLFKPESLGFFAALQPLAVAGFGTLSLPHSRDCGLAPSCSVMWRTGLAGA
jgi:putative MFS transporter